MSLSDDCQTIINEYLRGDLQAINYLEPKIRGMLISIICKYSINHEDFDEYYQVAWVAVMKCVKGYTLGHNTKFTSYTYIAVDREIRQYMNKQNKCKWSSTDKEKAIGIISLDALTKVSSLTDGMLTVGETIEDKSTDVEREVMIRELVPEVYALIETYPNAKQRQILYYFLEGRKQKWIADTLGVHVTYISKTVKNFYENCLSHINR